MATRNRTELLQDVTDNIRSGNADTTALGHRTVENNIIDSNFNKISDDSSDMFYTTGNSQTLRQKIESIEASASESPIISTGILNFASDFFTRPIGGTVPITNSYGIGWTNAIIADKADNSALITVNTASLGTFNYQLLITIVSNGSWQIDVSMFAAEVSTNLSSFQIALRERSSLVQNIQVKISLLKYA